jgi:hypothetical protein
MSKNGALLGQTARVDIQPWGEMNNYIINYAIYYALGNLLIMP